MKELGSCVGPVSGEHIVSEAVIRVLMADGDFSISGLPWLTPGEAKILPPQSLRANCLCTKHNSALHPLDDAAKYFFASLKSFLEHDTGSRHALVSGHDIERWLLKTAKAAAVSKNLARGRERLSGAFSRDEAILDMLDSPHRWPEGAGLYCTMNAGDRTFNHSRFQLQPLTNEQEDIEALALNILGGAPEQANFDSYQLLRIDQAPDITVEIISVGDEPGSFGEVGTMPMCSALGNATRPPCPNSIWKVS
jgi:hypothetical protein